MTYLLAIHKVADFTHWQRGYEASLAVRQKAGLKEKYLLRSIEDPNEVILLHEVEELQKAQAFTRSPELRERMKQAGVLGDPANYFLRDAEAPPPQQPANP
jgi:heme-degrading monooxygenase HmoA